MVDAVFPLSIFEISIMPSAQKGGVRTAFSFWNARIKCSEDCVANPVVDICFSRAGDESADGIEIIMIKDDQI